MGLKSDIMNAKVEGLKASGVEESDIDTSNGSAVEVESELIKEAVVNFLTSCEFRVTQLNANVVLDDLKFPDQAVNVGLETLLGDKAPIIDMIKKIPGVGSLADPLEGLIKKAVSPLLEGGSTLPGFDMTREKDGLNSTGYVFIGNDPDSQEGFDVSDEDGQREHTIVRLIRDDVEDLL
jgi:hypothetical protein